MILYNDRNIIETWTRLLLGSFFVMTGTAKIFTLTEFSFYIDMLLIFLDNSIEAEIISWGIILFEIISGLSLIIGKFRFRVLAAQLIFLTVSIVFTTHNLIFINSIKSCACFGAFGINFTPFQQLIFNVGLILLIIYQIGKMKRNIFLIISLSLLSGALIFSISSTHKVSVEFTAVKKLLSDHNQYKNTSESLLLFLNFNDFNCGLCLDDFNSFVEKIKLSNLRKRQLQCFVRRNDIDSVLQSRIILRWKKARGIPFEITLLNTGSFDSITSQKSGVVFFNRENNSVTENYTFPIGESTQKILIRRITYNDK